MNARIDRVKVLIARIGQIGRGHQRKEEYLTALTICCGLELNRIVDLALREETFKRFIAHVSRVARYGEQGPPKPEGGELQ